MLGLTMPRTDAEITQLPIARCLDAKDESSITTLKIKKRRLLYGAILSARAHEALTLSFERRVRAVLPSRHLP